MRRRKMKKKVKAIIAILVILGLLLIASSGVYCYLVSPMDKTSEAIIEVKIETGMSTKKIGQLLEKKGLIRDSNFFLVYTKLNNCASLKAATYDLKKKMTLNEIIDTICTGNVMNKEVINITFKEGKRITDYAKVISEKTSNSYEEVINVMKDNIYIQELIDKYWFLTEDILNASIYYPLEGYLFPDTYQFANKDVAIKTIIEKMLDQTDKVLSSYQENLQNKKHTIHEYITLASMAELEGTTTENRKMIIGIFENRLKVKMNLGSDVTTYYALQLPMTSDLTSKQFATKNPYNTRDMNMKDLPVGPIASISKSSLEATTAPTSSSYYYFVADKLGNIYYTKNSNEHLQKVQEIKEAGNWIW